MRLIHRLIRMVVEKLCEEGLIEEAPDTKVKVFTQVKEFRHMTDENVETTELADRCVVIEGGMARYTITPDAIWIGLEGSSIRVESADIGRFREELRIVIEEHDRMREERGKRTG